MQLVIGGELVDGRGSEADPVLNPASEEVLAEVPSAGVEDVFAAAASETLARVHLELGGKAPVVVLDDADVDAVVQCMRVAAFFNAGQDCTAATRIIATPRVQDAVVEALVPAAQGLKIGERRGVRRRHVGLARVLRGADGGRGPGPELRDQPARGLRTGEHGPARGRRGPGRTAASGSPATARTSPSTRWRSTRASST
jgi:hypothetical protein